MVQRQPVDHQATDKRRREYISYRWPAMVQCYDCGALAYRQEMREETVNRTRWYRPIALAGYRYFCKECDAARPTMCPRCKAIDPRPGATRCRFCDGPLVAMR